MTTTSWINTTISCIIILDATAAIGTGTVLCNATSRNRPANDLLLVAEPITLPNPPALFSTNLKQGTHHRPTDLRTPVPVPAPVLSIRKTILINTRHEHQNTMSTNLARHITNAGGHLTKLKYDGVAHTTHLTATVPSQYLDRIEPLLRRSSVQINPHYETWAKEAAAHAPERLASRPQYVEQR